MAEESLVMRNPQTSQSLVLDNNKERLAKKLSHKNKERFANNFIKMCDKYEGLDYTNHTIWSDLLNNRDELMILEELIFKRAKRNYNLIKFILTPILALIPIFGWLALGGVYSSDTDCVCYCRDRNKLEKIFGKDFFPFESLEKFWRSYWESCGDRA